MLVFTVIDYKNGDKNEYGDGEFVGTKQGIHCIDG